MSGLYFVGGKFRHLKAFSSLSPDQNFKFVTSLETFTMENNNRKFWSGDKISGGKFVGRKFRHPLKIFVTFPDIFFPDKVYKNLVSKLIFLIFRTKINFCTLEIIAIKGSN